MSKLLHSKKFMAMFVATITCTLSVLFDLPEEKVAALLNHIVPLVMAYVVGQGLADLGKEAKAVDTLVVREPREPRESTEA